MQPSPPKHPPPLHLLNIANSHVCEKGQGHVKQVKLEGEQEHQDTTASSTHQESVERTLAQMPESGTPESGTPESATPESGTPESKTPLSLPPLPKGVLPKGHKPNVDVPPEPIKKMEEPQQVTVPESLGAGAEGTAQVATQMAPVVETSFAPTTIVAGETSMAKETTAGSAKGFAAQRGSEPPTHQSTTTKPVSKAAGADAGSALASHAAGAAGKAAGAAGKAAGAARKAAGAAGKATGAPGKAVGAGGKAAEAPAKAAGAAGKAAGAAGKAAQASAKAAAAPGKAAEAPAQAAAAPAQASA